MKESEKYIEDVRVSEKNRWLNYLIRKSFAESKRTVYEDLETGRVEERLSKTRAKRQIISFGKLKRIKI